MRRPLTVIFRLFFLSVAALLAFGCQWGGDIYLDEGPDSETTSEETEFNGTTDTDSDMDTDTDTGTDTGTGVDTETDTGTGTGVDTETDTGTGTGVDTGTDTGTDPDTGHLDTDTGTGESESDPDSESASDTQWNLDPAIYVTMFFWDYRNNDAPDDQICAYLFDASILPDPKDIINEQEIDFALAAVSECMAAVFDPRWELPDSLRYRFGITFSEDQLINIGELDSAIVVGVLYYNNDTARALVPNKDYWGYSYRFRFDPEEDNLGIFFDLIPVREHLPENDH